MKKNYLFALFLSLGFFASPKGINAQTVEITVTVADQTISGGNYEFDLYLHSTANGPLYLGPSDFIFTYDETQFTSPSITAVTPATTFCTFVPNTAAQATQTQNNYYNALDQSLLGNEIRINLNLPDEPADLTEFNDNIAEIDGSTKTHRLGRFQISGVNTSNIADVALAWKSSGADLISQVFHFDNTGDFLLEETTETWEIEEGVKLSAKAYLQGPYSGGTMSDALRSGGLIPTTEPYTGLGFTHVNGGGEMTTAGVLAVTGNDAIVDWIFLELRDKNNSSTVVQTRSALIQVDGDIVDVDGTSPVTFSSAVSDDYFVAVRHRNHLGVMGASTLALSGVAASIDFSTVATYGTNAQRDMGSGVMGMIGGNANFDSQINAVDKNVYWRPQNGQSSNYMTNTADFNMDTAVNAVDKNIYWRVNNSIIEQLP